MYIYIFLLPILGLTVRTRGEQPSHAFVSPSIAPVLAQLLTGVSLCRRGTFPPRSAPSCSRAGVMLTIVFAVSP